MTRVCNIVFQFQIMPNRQITCGYIIHSQWDEIKEFSLGIVFKRSMPVCLQSGGEVQDQIFQKRISKYSSGMETHGNSGIYLT